MGFRYSLQDGFDGMSPLPMTLPNLLACYDSGWGVERDPSGRVVRWRNRAKPGTYDMLQRDSGDDTTRPDYLAADADYNGAPSLDFNGVNHGLVATGLGTALAGGTYDYSMYFVAYNKTATNVFFLSNMVYGHGWNFYHSGEANPYHFTWARSWQNGGFVDLYNYHGARPSVTGKPVTQFAVNSSISGLTIGMPVDPATKADYNQSTFTTGDLFLCGHPTFLFDGTLRAALFYRQSHDLATRNNVFNWLEGLITSGS